MTQTKLLLLIALLIVVSGCAEETAVSAPTPTLNGSPTTTTIVSPTGSALRPVATTTPTPAPAAAATRPLPTATAADPLPPPTLFDLSWEDRTLFRPGLAPAAEQVLTELPQAPFYLMDLTIADNMTQVSGRQEIRYVNQESAPLDALYLHLYPNLLGGAVTVSDVAVNGRAATPTLENSDTILRVPLPQPLAPNDALLLSLTFETAVPTGGGRNYGIFAFADGILTLAHFYPALAVYDEDGWDTDPATPQGDVTYADTSFFLVRVTAPARQTLVAGGVDVTPPGASDTWFAAGPMRDFYLVASADYIAHSRQIGGVTVHSYAPAGYEAGATAVLDFAANALASFNDRFGPYPFTELDVVATPPQALGVEYPGIVANTLRIYLTPSSSDTPDFSPWSPPPPTKSATNGFTASWETTSLTSRGWTKR